MVPLVTKSDFSVNLCPFLKLITHRHKMDTELDKNWDMLSRGHPCNFAAFLTKFPYVFLFGYHKYTIVKFNLKSMVSYPHNWSSLNFPANTISNLLFTYYRGNYKIPSQPGTRVRSGFFGIFLNREIGNLLQKAPKLCATKIEHSHCSTGYSTHLWLAD